MSHPHIAFTATKHCHTFCLELEMHIQSCRERQMLDNPVFRNTDLENDANKRTIIIKRLARALVITNKETRE